MRTPSGKPRRSRISLSLSSSEILMPSTLSAFRFGERAACHQDNPAATGLDRFALFFVCSDHIADRQVRRWSEVIGARPRCDHRARHVFRGIHAAAYQFERCRPVHSHPALGRVHRFGNAEPQFPQMRSKGDGAVPVDVGIDPGVVVGRRVGNDMGCGIGDSVERAVRSLGEIARRAGFVLFQPAISARECDRYHRVYSAISSISIQRRSCQLCMAASAS